MKGSAVLLGICTVLGVCGSAAAQDIQPPAVYIMEQEIKNVIHQLVEQLKNGIPDLGIPPLDPLNIKYQPVDLDLREALQLKGSIHDVLGHNLLGFNITKLKISLTPVSVEVKVEWDEMDVKGGYDINGHIASLLPVFGNGSFSGDIKGLYFHFRMDIGTKAGQLRVKQLIIDFGLGGIQVKIENFLGGLLGDVICEIINENFPEMVEQFKLGYMEGIKNAILEVVNGYLKDMTMQDVIEIITGLFPKPSTTTTSTTPSPSTTTPSTTTDPPSTTTPSTTTHPPTTISPSTTTDPPTTISPSTTTDPPTTISP